MDKVSDLTAAQQATVAATARAVFVNEMPNDQQLLATAWSLGLLPLSTAGFEAEPQS